VKTVLQNPSLKEFVRRRNGALTRELVQEPARFGLGKVPARPEARRDNG
jgi:hypothetical protein